MNDLHPDDERIMPELDRLTDDEKLQLMVEVAEIRNLPEVGEPEPEPEP